MKKETLRLVTRLRAIEEMLGLKRTRHEDISDGRLGSNLDRIVLSRSYRVVTAQFADTVPVCSSSGSIKSCGRDDMFGLTFMRWGAQSVCHQKIDYCKLLPLVV